MTQEVFAKRLGMSTRTLIRWEQSTKEIPPILLAAVSLLTDVNLGWLQTGVANQSDGSLEDVSVSMIDVRPEGFEPPTFWFGFSRYALAA
jgi:transcriptional regulator with XRE-family HTH domain